jgi:hypothetical protein
MIDDSRPPSTGVGRVLIAVYAILALASLGRSGYQIATKFEEAPLAYVLSALAAVVYVVATVALIGRGAAWFRVAAIAIGVELLGVLVVGTASLIDPALFPDDTVWSVFGRGYAFVPLVLPILGLLWLRRLDRARIRAHGRALASADSASPAAPASTAPTAPSAHEGAS